MDAAPETKAISRVIAFIDEVSRHTTTAYAVVVVTALLTMTVITCVQVFYRYVLASGLFWVEEVARGSLVWLTFAGAAVGVRHGTHIAITVIYRRTRGRARAIANLVAALVIAWVGWELITTGWTVAEISRSDTSPSLGISLFWYRLALPVGGVGVLVNVLPYLVRAALGIIQPRWSADQAISSAGTEI